MACPETTEAPTNRPMWANVSSVATMKDIMLWLTGPVT